MTDREVMQQALEALEDLDGLDTETECVTIDVGGVIAALKAALEQQQAEPECWCHKCNENKVVNNIPFGMTRMIVCPTCGNKRCPKASDHRLDCTGSNKTGQPGSVYSAPPQQQAEPVAWAVQACSKMWRGEFAEIDAKAEAKRIGGTCVAYPLYTTQPQRQWVGLTDEDVNRESAPIAQQMKLAFHAGMYVAQKVLKEKNSD